MVLFDESTSAIDATTEHQIYAHLIRLRVWFVTISHRSSLVHLHTKSLELYLNKNRCELMEEQQMSIASSFENHDENKLLKDESSENELSDMKNLRVSILFH